MSEKRKHEHRWREHRGHRWCQWHVCGAFQYKVYGEWRDRMRLSTFAEKWCPMVAGPEPEKMMVVEVAIAFEWNSYESWDTVFRVRFDFTGVTDRARAGIGTRTDVMNGWRSSWHEDFCEIDAEAEVYYKSRTGRAIDIGDNTYPQMRHFIQTATGPAQREPLKVVRGDTEGGGGK